MKEKLRCVSGWEATGGLDKHFPSMLSASSFVLLPAPRKSFRVVLRTLFIYHPCLLGSSATSLRARKPENSHIACWQAERCMTLEFIFYMCWWECDLHEGGSRNRVPPGRGLWPWGCRCGDDSGSEPWLLFYLQYSRPHARARTRTHTPCPQVIFLTESENRRKVMWVENWEYEL